MYYFYLFSLAHYQTKNATSFMSFPLMEFQILYEVPSVYQFTARATDPRKDHGRVLAQKPAHPRATGRGAGTTGWFNESPPSSLSSMLAQNETGQGWAMWCLVVSRVLCGWLVVWWG